MFNGIIKKTGFIKSISKNRNNCVIKISSSMNFNKNEIGSSISCSGTCLTLEKFSNRISTFYI